jgi:hypothetical protein
MNRKHNKRVNGHVLFRVFALLNEVPFGKERRRVKESGRKRSTRKRSRSVSKVNYLVVSGWIRENGKTGDLFIGNPEIQLETEGAKNPFDSFWRPVTASECETYAKIMKIWREVYEEMSCDLDSFWGTEPQEFDIDDDFDSDDDDGDDDDDEEKDFPPKRKASKKSKSKKKASKRKGKKLLK